MIPYCSRKYHRRSFDLTPPPPQKKNPSYIPALVHTLLQNFGFWEPHSPLEFHDPCWGGYRYFMETHNTESFRQDWVGNSWWEVELFSKDISWIKSIWAARRRGQVIHRQPEMTGYIKKTVTSMSSNPRLSSY